MLLKAFGKLLVGLSFLASASAFAAPTTVTVNFGDIESYGYLGDPDNFVGFVDIGANSRITSIAYDVNLTAFDPSWLADMVVAFERTDFLEGLFLTPAFDAAFPGTGSYSGAGDLVALGLDFAVAEDGLLRIEFFESWDDLFGVDGLWNFGTFTFGVETVDEPAPVPEPASALLLAAGLASMRYAGRRRAAKKTIQSAMH